MVGVNSTTSTPFKAILQVHCGSLPAFLVGLRVIFWVEWSDLHSAAQCHSLPHLKQAVKHHCGFRTPNCGFGTSFLSGKDFCHPLHGWSLFRDRPISTYSGNMYQPWRVGGGCPWRCRCCRLHYSAHLWSSQLGCPVANRWACTQVTKLLGVLSHSSVSLVDGFDVFSGFAISQGVLESLAECHHESIEVSQLWGIVIMEGDHPPHHGPF